MTRHDTHHDKLKQDIAELQASLKDFKQVRRDKREKDSEDSVIKTSDHQANRMF